MGQRPRSRACIRANSPNSHSAASAGLGATVEEDEKPVFVDSVKRIRKQMEPWGIKLKTFTHPKIGEL